MNFITMDSYLKGRVKLTDLSDELIRNANTIVPRANELLERFGSYRACTSGYRSPSDQARINPKATHSKHLICAAIDIEDKDGKLNKFCKEHPELLESIGLWCEERQGNWQHLQCLPFGSYKPGQTRWFNP